MLQIYRILIYILAILVYIFTTIFVYTNFLDTLASILAAKITQLVTSKARSKYRYVSISHVLLAVLDPECILKLLLRNISAAPDRLD